MDTTVENTDYMTVAEAARRERKAPETIWRWLTVGVIGRDGERHHLRHVKRGRDIAIKPQWLEDLFEALARRRDAS